MAADIVKAQNPKRRHHHVWQHYLKAWTTDGQIWCLQDGRLFSTGTPSIAVERDFYKLHKLTQEDVALIKMLFEKAHPLAKRNHANLLNMAMQPFQFADKLEPQQRAKLDHVIDGYASTILEDYHTGIEASFIPALESAVNGDVSFYDDDERCIPFLNYLCTQYMRTKGIKDRTIELCKKNANADFSRVWNLLIHMFATNIGASLYLERKRRKLVLVRNQTNVPFITGDQPAINLKGTQPHPPESLSIYYPLSPRLALVMADVDEEPLFLADGLTDSQALALNEKLFAASYRQVFAQSEETLRALSAKNSHPISHPNT